MTADEINSYLTPATSIARGKRVRGMWAIWTEAPYPGTGHDGEARFRCARVASKSGSTLRMEDHERRWAGDVWLLERDVPLEKYWPKYEWGTFAPLSREECLRVLSDALHGMEVHQ